jgi:hypothetical protein
MGFNRVLIGFNKVCFRFPEIDMLDLSSPGWVQVVSLWGWVAGRPVGIHGLQYCFNKAFNMV